MSRSLKYSAGVAAAAICIAVGSSIAWSTLAGSTSAPPYSNKADFDRAFADAASGHRDFKPAEVERLRTNAWTLISAQ